MIIEEVLKAFPDGSGIILAVFVIVCWFFLELGKFIYKIFKKDEYAKTFDEINSGLKEIKTSIFVNNKTVDQRLDNLLTEVELIKANYKSEERFKKIIEDKLSNLEKEVFIGNGQESLKTRISQIEHEIHRQQDLNRQQDINRQQDLNRQQDINRQKSKDKN